MAEKMQEHLINVNARIFFFFRRALYFGEYEHKYLDAK